MGFLDFIKSILNPSTTAGGGSHHHSPRQERRGGVLCSTPFCGQMTVIDSHTLCRPCYKIANPDGPPPSRSRLQGYNRLIDISGAGSAQWGISRKHKGLWASMGQYWAQWPWAHRTQCLPDLVKDF